MKRGEWSGRSSAMSWRSLYTVSSSSCFISSVALSIRSAGGVSACRRREDTEGGIGRAGEEERETYVQITAWGSFARLVESRNFRRWSREAGEMV